MNQIVKLLRTPLFMAGFLPLLLITGFSFLMPRLATFEDAEEIGKYPTGLRPFSRSVLIIDTIQYTLPEALKMQGLHAQAVIYDSTWVVKSSNKLSWHSEKVHLLGTTRLGQDMMIRLGYGIRSSLLLGGLAATMATLLGALIGVVAGYRGGHVLKVLSRLTNVFLVIPSFIVMILLSSMMERRSLLYLAVVIGIISWSWAARMVSERTVVLRQREHVALGIMNGLSPFGVIYHHIFPYLLSTLFMTFIMLLSTAILTEAALSMMGLGSQTSITLGKMLSDAQRNGALVNDVWWVFIPVILVITLLQLSLYIINSSMEQTLDPFEKSGGR